jgi:hypothetical protein
VFFRGENVEAGGTSLTEIRRQFRAARSARATSSGFRFIILRTHL